MENNLFDLSKALDTSNVNGNNFLSPVLLSKVISDEVRRMPVLRNMIKRTPWGTNIYTWNSILDHGNADTATDGATLSFSDASFAQHQAKMSYFYYIALITNPAILAAQELVDEVSLRIGGATKQVLRKENSVLFNGDSKNSQNPGLFSVLAASPTYGIAGDKATLSRSMLASMDIALRGEGYQPGVFVVSPGVYNIISEAAFNQVRFMGLERQAQIGYALSAVQAPIFNGIPVVMDKYAEKANAVAATAMVAGSNAKNFKFSADGVNVISGNAYRSAGSDFAGTTWSSPVVQISGVTKALGTDYSFAPDGSLNFVVTPGATPTAAFSYGAENILLLSLDPEDLVIAEQMGLIVEQDLAKPVQQDAIPFRVKSYSTLAVRNARAHVLATNVILPSSVASF